MKTKKIMALILSLCIVCSMFTGVLASEKDFSDVEENSWYYGDVQFVYEKGLMNGIDDDVFSPETPTTRGMVVTVLYRVEDSPSVLADAEFKDVNGDEYFADAVNWASENNIVNGYDDGNFGPEDLITREQAATIYFRYAQYKGEDVSADADLSAFEDADLISEYAVPAMKWALGTGLFKGVTNTSVAPDGNLTRAQLAATLRRTVEVEAEQPTEEPEPETKEYTVKFNLNYDEAETLESVKVKENEKVSAPKNPVRDNFVFNGWYTNSELTEKYDFDSEVTADLELFAKWNKKLVTGGTSVHIHKYTYTYNGEDQHLKNCTGCSQDTVEACTYTDGALVCDVCKTRELNPSNA
ncbi:MAG: S-layer homology domain-containing protein, partial [Clostridia bacterium]|nr:S-layer homology domain-containing protein [Clostridia bacterium]